MILFLMNNDDELFRKIPQSIRFTKGERENKQLLQGETKTEEVKNPLISYLHLHPINFI